jgi:chromosome partitioning protein
LLRLLIPVGDIYSGDVILRLVADARPAHLLILDTAPNADQTALRAAQLADLVLVPCRAAAFDLEAIKTTLTLAQIAQKPFSWS